MRAFVDLEALRAIEDGDERYQAAMAAFTQAKIHAGQRLEAHIQDMHRGGIAQAAYIAGCDASGLARRMRNQTVGFTLPTEGLVRLAYKFLHCTCHELYFGTPEVSRLPKHTSDIAFILRQCSWEQREDIQQYVTKLHMQDAENQCLYSQLSGADVLRHRIREAAGDRHIRPRALCGADSPRSLQAALQVFLREKNPSSHLRIQTIMYLAMSLDTSIDYWIAPDYTAHTSLRYLNDPLGPVVHSPAICDILTTFTDLSDASQHSFSKSLIEYARTHGMYADSTHPRPICNSDAVASH